jgi:hypothetical protein
MNLELDNVTPIGDPFVDKFAISRFHQLKAAFELFINPTGDDCSPFGARRPQSRKR